MSRISNVYPKCTKKDMYFAPMNIKQSNYDALSSYSNTMWMIFEMILGLTDLSILFDLCIMYLKKISFYKIKEPNFLYEMLQNWRKSEKKYGSYEFLRFPIFSEITSRLVLTNTPLSGVMMFTLMLYPHNLSLIF